ncbi:hypothetical protein GPECTOR_140g687 [Gonium pectorale]|uniref:Uncharacterized protein n=1 Tax=Gonium pectorale TaxID=33097 RepID=A0A150FY14_GONPE|nr:hypothetical protein GPECTOR_140g687 [Gonium pectorale]|eukprot:KXZ42511.1 hypothetical protein GPECTOR_140g687 [Gonium pectorale]
MEAHQAAAAKKERDRVEKLQWAKRRADNAAKVILRHAADPGKLANIRDADGLIKHLRDNDAIVTTRWKGVSTGQFVAYTPTDEVRGFVAEARKLAKNGPVKLSKDRPGTDLRHSVLHRISAGIDRFDGPTVDAVEEHMNNLAALQMLRDVHVNLTADDLEAIEARTLDTYELPELKCFIGNMRQSHLAGGVVGTHFVDGATTYIPWEWGGTKPCGQNIIDLPYRNALINVSIRFMLNGLMDPEKPYAFGYMEMGQFILYRHDGTAWGDYSQRGNGQRGNGQTGDGWLTVGLVRDEQHEYPPTEKVVQRLSELMMLPSCEPEAELKLQDWATALHLAEGKITEAPNPSLRRNMHGLKYPDIRLMKRITTLLEGRFETRGKSGMEYVRAMAYGGDPTYEVPMMTAAGQYVEEEEEATLGGDKEDDNLEDDMAAYLANMD